MIKKDFRLALAGRFFVYLCVAGLFCGVAALSYFSSAQAHTPIFYHTVVIDAGHGGIDGGVSGVLSGVKESEINLAIAKKLQKTFEKGGFKVVLTRTTSAGLYGHTGAGHKKRDMQARAKIIKNASPSLVISIHQNKFSASYRRGAQVFYRAGDEKGRALATALQNELNGLEENGRKSSPIAGDYYVINVSPCPAVIVECGFLSNEQDERLLLSEEYQEKLANSIFYGALGFLTSA